MSTRKVPTAYQCETHNCPRHSVLTPKPWGTKRGEEVLCNECNAPMSKKKMTEEQKRAVELYERALREEDRYLGSVFANRMGQERIEAKTKEAHDYAERLGVGNWC